MNNSREEARVNTAVDFILSHSEPPIFPRTIMTAATGVQVTVYSKEQILAYCKAANYRDCRINAFPKYTDYHGINRQPANFIFIDLDLVSFGNDVRKLDREKDRTCRKIKKVFGDNIIQPTFLWTGGGYHIYLPLSGDIIPEEHEVFAEFADWWKVNKNKDLTSVFMGFAEQFLTDGKYDRAHTPTVKSCLLRVPYTFNTKYNRGQQEVVIVQRWNGQRAAIQYILRDFRYYLFDNRAKAKADEIKRIEESIKRDRKRKRLGYVSTSYYNSNNNNNNNGISGWIECLLQIGIDDYRKRAISLILAPYLLHKKQLPIEEATQIMRDWLINKCEPLRHLDFRVESKVREALYYSEQAKILHMKFETLKEKNPELHGRLMQLWGERQRQRQRQRPETEILRRRYYSG